jgi:hypothetical protein
MISLIARRLHEIFIVSTRSQGKLLCFLCVARESCSVVGDGREASSNDEAADGENSHSHKKRVVKHVYVNTRRSNNICKFPLLFDLKERK